VVVSPVPRHAPFSGGAKPCALVIIGDREAGLGSPAKLLQQLYGLTPAEAVLATLLVQGRSLREAADERHVTIETVRSQLRQIFTKTDTSRQADLVRLILIGPAAFGASNFGEDCSEE